MAKSLNRTTTDDTTVKTTSTRTRKKTVADIEPEVTSTEIEKEVEDVKPVNQPKQTAQNYKDTDLILCKSLWSGILLFDGRQSGTVYKFNGVGDTQWIEYRDLRAAMLGRVQSLYAPYITIEDDVLLEDVHWNQLAKIYENLYDTDEIEQIINLKAARFNQVFRELPNGMQKSIMTVVSDKIVKGEFDSLQKIRIIDEVCRSDLKLLLED